MKIQKILTLLCIICSLILTSGCLSLNDDNDATGITIGTASTSSIINNPGNSGTAQGNSSTGADPGDIVENQTFTQTVKITFSGNSAVITNPVAGNGVDVTQANGLITIKSTISDIAYEVSGTIANGCLKIYSDNKFKLLLNNASITNTTGPAINVQSKKTVFVVLSGSNTLMDASSYSDVPSDEDAKGAFFSEGQLVFSGSGSLGVTGRYKHGIVSDDYIRIRDGLITVTGAVKDAIHASDYIIIDGGTLYLTAGSDGIDCNEGFIIINEGNFFLSVVDDGIVASYDIADQSDPDSSITPDVTINGGSFDITTTLGEGIESKNVMTINNGTFNINTVDDGINTMGNLFINGGNIYVHSSTNDAIDTNSDSSDVEGGKLTVTGGLIIAIGTGGNEGSFDSDDSEFKITGGTLLGLAGTTSFPTVSVCTQNSVVFDGVSAGTLLHLQGSDGTDALTYMVENTATTVFYSSPKLKTGVTYSFYTGGSVNSYSEFHGLYTSGTHTGGVATGVEFTISELLTQIGGLIGPSGPAPERLDPTDPNFTPPDPTDPNATPPDPNDPNATPPDPNDPNATPPDPNDPNATPPANQGGPDFTPGVQYLEGIGITMTALELQPLIGGPPTPVASTVVSNFAAQNITITQAQAQALLDALNLL